MPFPIIDVQTYTAPTGVLGLFAFEGQAISSNTHLYTAQGLFGFDSDALATNERNILAEGLFQFDSDAIHQLDGSPDRQVAATGLFQFESSAGATRGLSQLLAYGTFEFVGSSSGDIVIPSKYQLTFIIDLLGVEPVETFYRLEQERFTVQSAGIGAVTECPIVSWTYTESENTAGAEFSAVLARPADVNLFTPGTLINLELGKKVAGTLNWDEPTMYFVFQNGVFRGWSKSMSWNEGPADTITISAGSDLNERLLSSIGNETIFYDTEKEEVDTSEIEPIRNTGGTPSPIIKVGIANMTLYDILQYIFVNACEFAGWETNLPSFPVKRLDAHVGQPAFDAVKGLIGMFEPLIYIKDDKVWVIDTTNLLPEGFPTPREIEISDYKELSQEYNRNRIDGILLHYSELESDWTFFTLRQERKSQVSGNSHIETVSIYKEFRHEDRPYIVVKEALHSVITKTRVGTTIFGRLVEEVEEEFVYDRLGLLTQRTRDIQSLLPSPITGLLSMMPESDEEENFTYKRHPYKPKQMYLAHKALRRKGLIYVDEDNPQLGQPFSSPLKTAFRSGNLMAAFEPFAANYDSIYSRDESIFPLRNKQIRTRVKEVDETANLVVVDYTEERTGDVGFDMMKMNPKRVLVTETYVGQTVPGIGIIESLSVGELPLQYGLPLAYRRLSARKSRLRKVVLNMIGYVKSIRRGSLVHAKGRADVSLGNYIVLGRTISGDINGVRSSLTSKEI